MAVSIKDVLQGIGLSTFINRFAEEKNDVDQIVGLNDEEFIRLGVSTIGDRIRLKNKIAEIER